MCVYTCVYDCMYVCVHMHLCDYRDTCHLQVAPLATSNFVVTFRAYHAPVSVLCVLIVLLSRMLLKFLFSHFPCHSCSTWAVFLVSTSLMTSVCIQMQLLWRSMPSSTSRSSWQASFVPQSLWLQSGCSAVPLSWVEQEGDWSIPSTPLQLPWHQCELLWCVVDCDAPVQSSGLHFSLGPQLSKAC